LVVPADTSGGSQRERLLDWERNERFCFTRTMHTPATRETQATVNKPPSMTERETDPFPPELGGPFPLPGTQLGGPFPLPGNPLGGPLPLPGTAHVTGANRASDASNAAATVRCLKVRLGRCSDVMAGMYIAACVPHTPDLRGSVVLL
jgi:hypothetical protein